MFRPLPPKLRIFDVDLYQSFEAQKMVFGPALILAHKDELKSSDLIALT